MSKTNGHRPRLRRPIPTTPIRGGGGGGWIKCGVIVIYLPLAAAAGGYLIHQLT